jgi:hypothetical protein
MTMDRQRKLQDALDHLNEVEKLKNFKFEPWRKRFLQWMRHNKSRIMELFRRIDRDKDGRITRKEFIDGIISTSKIIILTISYENIYDCCDTTLSTDKTSARKIIDFAINH